MNRWKKLLSVSLLTGGALLSAGDNLWYNSSFELGLNGWNEGSLNYHFPYDPQTAPVPHQWLEVKDAPHGKHVMQLTNYKKIASFTALGATDVQLVPGKKYTVSLYVKPEVDCSISYSVHSNHNEVWHSASGFHSHYVRAGKWQRVHTTFVYQPKKKFPDDLYHTTFLVFNLPQNEKSILLDAFQLEEGELSDYKPASAMEYSVTMPTLYLTKDNAEIEFSAFSHEKSGKVTKELVLFDTGKNRETGRKSVTFDLVPGKIVRQKVSFDKVPYGGFKIFAQGEHKAVAADFVHIHPNTALYEKGKFAVGIGTQALGTFNLPWRQGIKLQVSPGKYTQDEGELVRHCGAIVAYSFDGATNTLGALSPDKRGEYNWQCHDLLFKRARELKLKMMASLGSSTIFVRSDKTDLGSTVPQWLRKMDRTGHPEGTWQGGWGQVRVILPPPDPIAEAAAELCKRYENDICMFRLFGEANGYIRAPQLVEYAKAVYAAIKKAAPDTLVNSLNATEDGGSAMGGYFDQYLKAGGGDCTDAVSFHPYRCSQDDSAVSAMDGIQAFYKTMKKYNKRFPLAQTECFYLIANPYNGTPEYTWSLFEPAAIARRMIIDLGEGLIMSIPLEVGHLHKAMAAHDQSSRGYFHMVPKAHFAVHNAMGHFLNNADLPERVMLPGNELCYKFRKGGKLYSAIWRITGKSDMVLNLPSGVSCKVYDIYGNVLQTAKGKLKMELNREPAILEWSKGADPVKLHKAAEYVPRQLMEFYGLKVAKDGILVMLCNRSGKPLSGQLRVSSEFLKGGKVKFRNVAPHTMMSILVPAELKADAPEKFSVNVVLSADGKVEQTRKELSIVPVVKVKKAGTTVRVKDHSFTLRKQGNMLKISAKLASTKMRVPSKPENTWEGDCVEIYLDLEPQLFNPADPDRHTGKCYQLIIGATKDGKSVIDSRRLARKVELPAGAEANVKLLPGKGAKVEVLVPWIDGMGFNIRFDGSGKGATWRGQNNYKQRNHFVVLTEEK